MARGIIKTSILLLVPLLLPTATLAVDMASYQSDYTTHWAGLVCVAIFVSALLLVAVEEFTNLRKSKPVLISSGVIWALIAWLELTNPMIPIGSAESAVRDYLQNYIEILLIILVAMTYVNAMSERQLFAALGRLVCCRLYSYRTLFWMVGLLSFFISPFINNLATVLVASAIILAIGGGNRKFIALTCTNVVIAANAGGAFSPFGDITTLMVWGADIKPEGGALTFSSFFTLFPAALASYLIPSIIMYFAVPQGGVKVIEPTLPLRRGAKRVVLLFLATIATAVFFNSVLKLPTAVGMLTGLSYLQLFGFYLKKTHSRSALTQDQLNDNGSYQIDSKDPFDIFASIARSEWDTLVFLYGIAMSVGGLAYLGYLDLASDLLYGQLGATTANISLGLLSSILADIPVMYGVLHMAPDMPYAQWLLITLAVGTGSSLLSISSIAGVAMMGQVRDHYTFFYHLRWTPAILLGYICGIGVYLLLSPTL